MAKKAEHYSVEDDDDRIKINSIDDDLGDLDLDDLVLDDIDENKNIDNDNQAPLEPSKEPEDVEFDLEELEKLDSPKKRQKNKCPLTT